jgi:hypothetical protein
VCTSLSCCRDDAGVCLTCRVWCSDKPSAIDRETYSVLQSSTVKPSTLGASGNVDAWATTIGIFTEAIRATWA